MVAPRPDCAIPKMSLKVVRQHQNAGSKMRPFSESSGNMPVVCNSELFHALRKTRGLDFLANGSDHAEKEFIDALNPRTHGLE